MTKLKIIRRLRALYKAEQFVRETQNKLTEAIEEVQGSESQAKCGHGTYGNSYIPSKDVCSQCWKILTREDLERDSLW